MKIIITILILLLINFVVLDDSVTNNETENEKSDELEENLSKLPQKKMGLLTKLKNGPINEDEVPNGDEPVAVVTFSNSVKNKKIGKMRISGKGVNVIFPTDTNYTYIKHLNEKDEAENFIEKTKLEQEKKTILDSHNHFKNEFSSIYENEHELLDNKSKKNLLNLSIEKEQEIYNKLIENELDEVKDRSYNGGIITPLLSYNLKNTKKFFKT